jgi:hypothetical protein
VGGAGGAGAMQFASERVGKHIVNQRTLARAADARDRDEGAERKGHIDVFEIVMASPANDQARPFAVVDQLRIRDAAITRDRDVFST